MEAGTGILSALFVGVLATWTAAPAEELHGERVHGEQAQVDRSQEMGRALVELSAPDARVRAAAQRWIGVHARADDLPRLLAAARGGDAEVRHRMIRILASAERHLGLCCAFVRSGDSALADIGRRALESQVVQWNPALGQVGIESGELGRKLAERSRLAGGPLVRLDMSLPFEDRVGLLARHGDLPVLLVIDPDLPEKDRRRTGTGELLLGSAELIENLGTKLGFDGHGFDHDADHGLDRPAAPFVRWTSHLREANEPASQFLVEWLGIVLDDESDARRRRAAVALADCGWPAVLRLFAEEWQRSADPIFLAGLVRAAAQGRVAPVLAMPETLRRLVELTSRDLTARDPWRRNVARETWTALTRLGCIAPDGQDLVEVVLADWDQATPVGRQVRLGVAARWGCDGREELLARARECLARDDRALRGELAFEGLLALAMRGSGAASPGLVVGDPAGLVQAAASLEARRRAWPTLLERARPAPPPAWEDPAGVPRELGRAGRLLVFQWMWISGPPRAAVAHARSFLNGQRDAYQAEAELARILLAHADESQRQEAFFADLYIQFGPGAAARVDRLALLAGRDPRGNLSQILRTAGRVDLPVLAAIAGRTRDEGDQARRLLVGLAEAAARTREGPSPELLSALEEAVRALQRDELKAPPFVAVMRSGPSREEQERNRLQAILEGSKLPSEDLEPEPRTPRQMLVPHPAQGFPRIVRRAVELWPGADEAIFDRRVWPLPPRVDPLPLTQLEPAPE